MIRRHGRIVAAAIGFIDTTSPPAQSGGKVFVADSN